MKRPLDICLVLALIFAGTALVVFHNSRDRVVFSNYRLLEEGMPESEVREILGPPSSWSFRGKGLHIPGPWPEERIAKVGSWFTARTGTHIAVGFDDAQKVVAKIFTENGPRED